MCSAKKMTRMPQTPLLLVLYDDDDDDMAGEHR